MFLCCHQSRTQSYCLGAIYMVYWHINDSSNGRTGIEKLSKHLGKRSSTKRGIGMGGKKKEKKGRKKLPTSKWKHSRTEK